MTQNNRRINRQIRVPEVRLIGAEGEQIGVVSADRAMELAEEVALDLVEISPTAKPPVCKIMDYGKFLFEEEKKKKEAKKKQKIIHLKEVKFRPKIDDHDFAFKIKSALNFLQRGDKLKITVRFRGREMRHPDLGFEIVEKAKAYLTEHIDFAEEKRASMEGRNITLILAPGKKAARKSSEDDQNEPETAVPDEQTNEEAAKSSE